MVAGFQVSTPSCRLYDKGGVIGSPNYISERGEHESRVAVFSMNFSRRPKGERLWVLFGKHGGNAVRTFRYELIEGGSPNELVVKIIPGSMQCARVLKWL